MPAYHSHHAARAGCVLATRRRQLHILGGRIGKTSTRSFRSRIHSIRYRPAVWAAAERGLGWSGVGLAGSW